MGLLQLFFDAGLASTAIAKARQKGIIKIDLTKWPTSQLGQTAIRRYLMVGEKILET